MMPPRSHPGKGPFRGVKWIDFASDNVLATGEFGDEPGLPEWEEMRQWAELRLKERKVPAVTFPEVRPPYRDRDEALTALKRIQDNSARLTIHVAASKVPRSDLYLVHMGFEVSEIARVKRTGREVRSAFWKYRYYFFADPKTVRASIKKQIEDGVDLIAGDYTTENGPPSSTGHEIP